MRKGIIIGGVAAAVALVSIGIAANGSKGSTATAAAPVETVKTVTVTAPAKPPVTKTVTVTAPPVTVTAPAPAPVTVTEAPPAPVVVGPAEEIKKSGVYVVGQDIKAGKWKSDGKIDKTRYSGYFAILADPTGSTSDTDNILTNENPDGQAFATLEDGQGLDNSNLHWVYVGE